MASGRPRSFRPPASEVQLKNERRSPVKLRACFVIVSFVSFLSAAICTAQAQTEAPQSSPASTQVPRLIKFSGLAQDETRKPVSGVVGISFSLYKDQEGGSPLWMETQNVQADASGH